MPRADPTPTPPSARGRGLRQAPEPEPERDVVTRPSGWLLDRTDLDPAADPGRPAGPALLRSRPAPLSARLGAAVVDEVALTLPLVPVVALGLHAARTPGAVWHLAATLALMGWLVAALVYVVVGAGEGQTLGKRVLGIVVVDEATGRPIGYERALLRCVVLLLMGLPCCLGLLSVVSVRSVRHRGWHDRAAGSVVVGGSLP